MTAQDDEPISLEPDCSRAGHAHPPSRPPPGLASNPTSVAPWRASGAGAAIAGRCVHLDRIRCRSSWPVGLCVAAPTGSRLACQADGAGPQDLRGAHLRVPDERARLRAHRRPAGGRRAASGRERGRRRRGRAQHLLHPRERRQQALRQPRPAQGAQGSAGPTCRSWSVAAWPRRTATSSSSGRPTSTSCSAPTTCTGPPSCWASNARPAARWSRSWRRPRRRPRLVPSSALPVPAGRWPTPAGSPSRSAATTRAPSASCPRCGARRSAGRSTTSSTRSGRWPPRASPR